MQQNLTIEKRTFKSKDGDRVNLKLSYDGETFFLKPRDAEKDLLYYLLEGLPAFGEKPISLPVEITKEQFTDEHGESFDYYAYTFTLERKEFKLKPRPEDKRLLTYLLNLAK